MPGTGPDILAEGNPERTKSPYMYGMGHDVHSEHTFRPRSAALEIQPRMKMTAYNPKHALTGGGALNVCADSRLQRDRAALRKSGGLSPSISESLLGDKLRLELYDGPPGQIKFRAREAAKEINPGMVYAPKTQKERVGEEIAKVGARSEFDVYDYIMDEAILARPVDPSKWKGAGKFSTVHAAPRDPAQCAIYGMGGGRAGKSLNQLEPFGSKANFDRVVSPDKWITEADFSPIVRRNMYEKSNGRVNFNFEDTAIRTTPLAPKSYAGSMRGSPHLAFIQRCRREARPPIGS